MSRHRRRPRAKRANPLVRVIYAWHGANWPAHDRPARLLTGDIPIRAHRPRLLVGYGLFEKAVASKPRVAERLRALAVLKSAVMQGCEMCQDIGSHEARARGHHRGAAARPAPLPRERAVRRARAARARLRGRR